MTALQAAEPQDEKQYQALLPALPFLVFLRHVCHRLLILFDLQYLSVQKGLDLSAVQENTP